MTDCVQYEKDYVIQTQTVHTIPQVWKEPPHIHQGRIKAYRAAVVVDSEDSMSSDGNLAGKRGERHGVGDGENETEIRERKERGRGEGRDREKRRKVEGLVKTCR